MGYFNKVIILLLLGAAPLYAQGPVVVDGKYPQLPQVLGPLGGLPVECIAGCDPSAAPSEPEDNDIAAGQTMGRSVSLSYVFDGAKWVRATAGGGGLTDVQIRATPLPVSFTLPISVTQSGTWNIATVTTLTGITNPVAVTGSFWQATQPVSGTFWQATQPVSGTFFQATQPVSIASMPSTPVTGTFWQATQPVSFTTPISVTQSGVWTVAVTGTFWQTTQPVSGTFWQATQPVSGTFWQTTQPISGAVSQSGTWTVQPGNTPNSTAWLVTGTGGTFPITSSYLTQSITGVGPALTKGVQASLGHSTQDLKDSGRNITNYFMAAPIITTTAEVMQSLTGYKGGIAVAATVTPAVVTAAKIYRISNIEITYWAATVIGGARINLRANLSGTGAVGSPLVKSWQVGIPAIFTAGSAMTYNFDYPDGIEFAAGTGIAIGVIGEGAVPTTGTITGYVLIAINGFEY